MNMNFQFSGFQRKRWREVKPEENGPDGGKKSSPGNGGKKAVKGLALGLLAVFLIFSAINSFYTLNENTMAVVTTFGIPKAVSEAGPHFKLPYIQQVHKISKNIVGMAIGYDPDYDTEDHANSENNPAPVKSESEMITKDFNFVNVDFYIEYQVVDPIKYYVNRDTATEILKNLAQSYIRDTVGVYNVDDVITTGKAEIQGKVKEQLSSRVMAEDIGIGIYNVTIQDAQPPTEDVNNAFKAVEDAKQGMDTAVNEAKKYQSEQIPTANAKADKVKQDAEAYKQQRISEAEGQVARFNEMYAEYEKYPLITKKRMFYEAMEDVLPSLKVIIDSGDGTEKLLPLEPFSASTEGNGGQETGNQAEAYN